MPGFLMHVNAVMSCFHQAGQATIPPTQPRVLVNGQPVATVAAEDHRRRELGPRADEADLRAEAGGAAVACKADAASRPVPGDFRIQVQYGGVYTALGSAPAGALALAEQTLTAIDAPLLYARIDAVPDADGRWMLMEAELIEPDFYLGVDPQAGAGFADAVRALLGRQAQGAGPGPGIGHW